MASKKTENAHSLWLGSDGSYARETTLASRIHYRAKDGSEKVVDVSEEVVYVLEMARLEGRRELQKELKKLLF